MTLSDLIVQIDDIKKKAEDIGVNPVVKIRLPGALGFIDTKITLTYTSQSREGTTFYDQVPAILFEPDVPGTVEKKESD